MFLFQLFKRIWPTRSSHSKYLNLFDSVPYSEKLMGRPPTIFFSSPKCCLAETFEMFYGGNREAGRAVVNSYCKAKNHLQVPKPEQLLLPKPDLSLNLPPLKMPPQPKPCVPVQSWNKSLFISGQVKSSERKLRYCPPQISLPLAFVQGRWDQMLNLRRKWRRRQSSLTQRRK